MLCCLKLVPIKNPKVKKRVNVVFLACFDFQSSSYSPSLPHQKTDMRQDQLVVQLIDLCDRLFKKDGNLDLKLTPYKIVCLSRNCGKKNIKVVVGRSALFF